MQNVCEFIEGVPSEALTTPALLSQRACESIGGMPSEALTPLAPLSQGERGEQNQEKEPLAVFSPSFSLLSLWERRAGVVRASEGTSPKNSQTLGDSHA